MTPSEGLLCFLPSTGSTFTVRFRIVLQIFPCAMRRNSLLSLLMNTKHLRESETILELFYGRVQQTPDEVAFEYELNGGWREVTYREYGEWVSRASMGFHQMGVRAGDCVAIWGDTLPEWTVLSLGAATAGAHTAGIYQTSTPDQAAYILQDSKARILCVDTPARLEQAMSIKDQTPTVERYILWSGAKPDGIDAEVITLDELLAQGDALHSQSPDHIDTLRKAVTTEHYAILIYTSGTTGPPKGVVLTHGNCVSNAIRLFDIGLLEPGDSTIAFLPMSHVAEYTLFLGRLYGNIRAFYCPDFQRIGEVVRTKSPTLLIAVPRVHEKVYQKIMGAVESYPPRKQRIFHWALGQGKRVAQYKWEGKAIPPSLMVTHRIADSLVLSKIRQQLGGNVRMMGSAAAPIDVEIIEFFWGIGITFLEAYGLSESCGASHTNRPDAFRIGSVGQVVDGYECIIAEDGEVLLRGPAIFKGYLNRPEDTAEALDDEGWLHTGDIGEIDADGYLKITDRKKNLIITAGGKNVAPSNIETLIKREPIVSQVVVIGDRKPYLVALVTLTEDGQKLPREDAVARLDKAIQAANDKLAKYESVKKFKILEAEFSVESGEMTPTMKIKRNVVMKNHAEVIDKMYSDGGKVTEKETAKSH